jgi:hypothetical protein
MTVDLPQFYYSDVYEDMCNSDFDYKDMNGFDGYIDPVLELLDTVKSLPDTTVNDLIDYGSVLVRAFTSEDAHLNTYWGVHTPNFGVPVMGTSSYAIYVADKVGRGLFLDDYMVGEVAHPLLEGIGWYYNPVKWATAALVVRDLIGIAPQWGPDQFEFMTMPWETIVGDLPRSILTDTNNPYTLY